MEQQIKAEIDQLSSEALVILLSQLLPNCIVQPHALEVKQNIAEEELINQLKIDISNLDVDGKATIAKMVLRQLKNEVLLLLL
ncbi:hypothetical protein NUACC21_78770 [Scytonema sp. NUACC21]